MRSKQKKLNEKLKEIELLRNNIGFQGVTRKKVIQLMRLCLRLESAFREVIKQRNRYIKEVMLEYSGGYTTNCEIDRLDKKLLKLLENL